MTRRVWLAQCLCPDRHAIIAAAGEASDKAEAEATVGDPLRRQIAELLKGGMLNPWCGICGARENSWVYEVRPSRFRTMREAMPQLHQTEAENILASALYGDTHRTKRSN